MTGSAGGRHPSGGIREIVDDFTALAQKDRLELLLEFSRELPALPERYAGDHDAMEAVTECQSPVFVRVETGATLADEAKVYFDAPAEAPTTRASPASWPPAWPV